MSRIDQPTITKGVRYTVRPTFEVIDLEPNPRLTPAVKQWLMNGKVGPMPDADAPPKPAEPPTT